ncbi:hypothetical protein BDP27DRAFT_1265911 [Rhodocollybia butyracea]|uniref:Fe2OG dioxygenase domain-containing protein n=1 Tax=Rhodocollybia butyracea TaxID=206335 RepID=A0A9P5PRD6_9AGAR|nr:hypothetical protein BDP27DRAFT_1265911 [Rhodocollybia butyracea]
MAKRLLSSLANFRGNLPSEFHFIPDFFSLSEQRTLLSAALLRLDATGSRRYQKKRKSYIASEGSSSIFLPDGYYEFMEGHYDGVIHNYREMHLTSWPTAEISGLSPVLDRLHSLLPFQTKLDSTQTHLLHLASNGEILPHIDNVSASGHWILGVSLGADRTLRLESCIKPEETVDVLLPSGSVYIQSDSVRYQYKHSILKNRSLGGATGQRISVMIRVSSSVG